MPITFILFNGPPRSGKSTSARDLGIALRFAGFTTAHDSFAAPMKHYIATALGDQYNHMQKDVPLSVLSGYSVRQFLISESEDHMKPRYGEDVFARLLYHRTLRITPLPDYVLVDDNGFKVEGDTIGVLGERRIIIKMVRPECTFKGDSRSYWLTDPEYDYIFENDGSDEARVRKLNILASLIPKRHLKPVSV